MKILVLSGGGDAPGLNAVIRGVCKRARKESLQGEPWEVYGSIEAFNGVLNEPQEIVKLTSKKTAGIQHQGWHHFKNHQ